MVSWFFVIIVLFTLQLWLTARVYERIEKQVERIARRQTRNYRNDHLYRVTLSSVLLEHTKHLDYIRRSIKGLKVRQATSRNRERKMLKKYYDYHYGASDK